MGVVLLVSIIGAVLMAGEWEARILTSLPSGTAVMASEAGVPWSEAVLVALPCNGDVQRNSGWGCAHRPVPAMVTCRGTRGRPVLRLRRILKLLLHWVEQ